MTTAVLVVGGAIPVAGGAVPTFVLTPGTNSLTILFPQTLAAGAVNQYYQQSAQVYGTTYSGTLASATVTGATWANASVSGGAVTIYGTPIAAGTYTLTVTVYDTLGNYGSETVTCDIL